MHALVSLHHGSLSSNVHSVPTGGDPQSQQGRWLQGGLMWQALGSCQARDSCQSRHEEPRCASEFHLACDPYCLQEG